MHFQRKKISIHGASFQMILKINRFYIVEFIFLSGHGHGDISKPGIKDGIFDMTYNFPFFVLEWKHLLCFED